MDSIASFGSGGGGLRERANTAGSVRSRNDSHDYHTGTVYPAPPFPEPMSPLRSTSSGGGGRSGRNISFGMSPTTNTTTSSSSYSGGRSQVHRKARQIVEWVQRQRVPSPWYRQGRRFWIRVASLWTSSGSDSSHKGIIPHTTTTTKTATTSSHHNHKQESVPLVFNVIDEEDHVVYWVEGIDRVVFGTSSAAEVVRIVGVQPPRYLWYMISGAGCDIIQLSMDIVLSNTLVQDASICWAITFFLSVVFRHSFHRYLVFGDYVGGYRASLFRMYGGYSIIIVLSTIFNIIMTRVATLSHYMAWILTLLWTGIANYFILKKLWSFGGGSSSATGSGTGGTSTK
jgi:hypothetical protein